MSADIAADINVIVGGGSRKQSASSKMRFRSYRKSKHLQDNKTGNHPVCSKYPWKLSARRHRLGSPTKMFV
jgi:hypothetical protein